MNNYRYVFHVSDEPSNVHSECTHTSPKKKNPKKQEKNEREHTKTKKTKWDDGILCVFKNSFHFQLNSYFIWHFIDSVLNAKLDELLLLPFLSVRFSFTCSLSISVYLCLLNAPLTYFIPNWWKWWRDEILSTLDGDDSMWFLYTHTHNQCRYSDNMHITSKEAYIHCDGIVYSFKSWGSCLILRVQY